MCRLIAISIVKNEADNYLADWLKNMKNYTDYHIFLDDASTDNTPNLIQTALNKGYKGELHIRTNSLFQENEPALRSELWEYTRKIAKEGDWILIVDADEFYDEHLLKFKKKLQQLNNKKYACAGVSCLDMWTESKYRVDGFWSPTTPDIRLIAYKNVKFENSTTCLHAPPYPASTDITKIYKSFIPKIHLAYLREKDRLRKYRFYTENTEIGTISHQHALSILDVPPKLKRFRNIKKIIGKDSIFTITVKNIKRILNIG